MSFVYILQSEADNLTYIGRTDDIDKRLEEHNSGYVASTKERRPLKLIAYFKFGDRKKADNFERYLKSGSGRAFLKRHML